MMSKHYHVTLSFGKSKSHTYVDVFFRSTELKAQVSFSDRLLSVVRPSVCPSVCKLFTFSSYSQEPLGQFQPNLTQSILGWWGFNFVQMKGPRPFPRGDNKEIAKIHWQTLTRGPQALTVTWVSETLHWLLVKGLIFVYQQPHHRINENQLWYRKAES